MLHQIVVPSHAVKALTVFTNLHVDGWFLNNNNNHCDNKFVTTKCGLAILMRTFHGH
jgi:hypothetical protein